VVDVFTRCGLQPPVVHLMLPCILYLGIILKCIVFDLMKYWLKTVELERNQ